MSSRKRYRSRSPNEYDRNRKRRKYSDGGSSSRSHYRDYDDEKNDRRDYRRTSSSSSSSSSLSYKKSKNDEEIEINDRGNNRSNREINNNNNSNEENNKNEPFSLEEIVKKKKEAEENENKVVFLTKKQREQIALEKRKQKVEEMKRKREEDRKKRQKYLQSASSSSNSGGSRYEGRSGGRNRNNRNYDDYYQDDNYRRNGRNRYNDYEGGGGSKEDFEKMKEKRKREKELEEIKNHYLGLNKPKKRKIVKPTEKLSKIISWNLEDDTSSQDYSNRTFYKPKFGRGFIGGVDRDEQSDEYKKKLKGKRKKIFEMMDTKREKGDKRLYNKYSGSGNHWSDKSLDQMLPRDWRIFKEDFNISTRGGNIPNPYRSWEESAGIPEEIIRVIREIGYKTPTAIQMQAIPIGLQRRDIVGLAETGSGKTAAFVIPMLSYILSLPPLTPETEVDGPLALIMAPTRELVTQIDSEIKKLAKYLNIRTVVLVGGNSIEEQGFQLRKGCEVIVATPGRLIDCLGHHYAVLNQCNYVVMDEADQMVDMGFETQVNDILEAMPSIYLKDEDEEIAEQQEKDTSKIFRTTIMFSATMPPGVERLSRKYLRHPAYVAIGEVGKTVDSIEQRVIFTSSNNEKHQHLLSILQSGPPPPIIIFLNTKRACDSLQKFLEREGNYKNRIVVLHSGKSQDVREYNFMAFKNGRYDILIATDVAGRGLDVKGVSHVINYDLPSSIEQYTHRVGRTGRAGLQGLATSFLTNDDTSIMYDLRQMLKNSKSSIVPQELDQHPAAQFKNANAPVKM